MSRLTIRAAGEYTSAEPRCRPDGMALHLRAEPCDCNFRASHQLRTSSSAFELCARRLPKLQPIDKSNENANVLLSSDE